MLYNTKLLEDIYNDIPKTSCKLNDHTKDGDNKHKKTKFYK